MRVVVFGASGFVGTAVVERLSNGDMEIIPVIRSDASAWRLIRRSDVQLCQLDILDNAALDEILKGCTHVINCTRGTKETMLRGLKNLLAASRRAGVQRFVHLSSVAVYGDPPSASSVSETAATKPARGTYGWIKLQQDEIVIQAARDGLKSVVLCPPNITGPYSPFLLQIVGALCDGSFALVRGVHPCVTVDVANLAAAVELSLTEGVPDGSRYFVTDDDNLNWDQMIAELSPLAETGEIPVVEEDLVRSVLPDNGSPKLSPLRAFKHVFSDEVRRALRQDPLLAMVERGLRNWVDYLPERAFRELQHAVSGTIHVPTVSRSLPINMRLCGQQLRDVRHSCGRAKSELGYAPEIDHSRSLRSFGDWFNYSSGRLSEWWPLLKQMYPQQG
jgi:nucleoside-diphosphate-sugar epimerase